MIEIFREIHGALRRLANAVGVVGREQVGGQIEFANQFGEVKGLLSRHAQKVDLQLTLLVEQGKATNERLGVIENKRIKDLQAELDELKVAHLLSQAESTPTGSGNTNGNGDAE